MSYILDALRKSDQQRQRGTAPTLLAGQGAIAAPAPVALVPAGVLAVALISAGMLIGWLRPWQTDHVTPAMSPPMAARSPESSLHPKAADQTTLPPKPEAQGPVTQASVQAPPAVIAARPPSPPRAKPLTDGAARETSVAAPGKTTSVSTATTPQPNGGIAGHGGANAGAVVTMGELPPAIQQELPAMNISVHAYSPTPGSRLVGINNQMFKEGSQVAPGLELEQITPEGMVFGYKGYHFRRGVK